MSHATPEVVTSAQTQTRRLSSVLTPLFKLGVPSLVLTSVLVCNYVQLRQEPIDFRVLAWVFPWAFALLVAYWCFRLKKVIAHCDHLTVSNYLTDTSVQYEDIEEIRGYRGRSAVFVRLRLRSACRYGRTIHFLLPSTLSRMESQPEIELLRQKCPWLIERSRNWWLATLYLRPAHAGLGESQGGTGRICR